MELIHTKTKVKLQGSHELVEELKKETNQKRNFKNEKLKIFYDSGLCTLDL